MTIFKESLLHLAEAQSSSPPPTLSALIVDDEIGNLRVLRSMLGNRFRILEASDGAEALELLAGLAPSELPAIVISDQRMPRMTGVELFERLRESLPSAIRIIITGFVDVGAIVDAINRAGIYRFVVKPFTQDELQLTIDRAIEAYESNRSIDARIEQGRLTDPVTGLGNRAAMIPTLVAAPTAGVRDGLLLVDIDRFKTVNDSLGCAAGDALLRGVAAIVRAHCREGELAVRWGDEEFLLHVRVADESQAHERARQLRAAIVAASFDLGGGRMLRCSCTIGAACAPPAATGTAVDWEQALRDANKDLQQARRGARTTGEQPLADRRQPPGAEPRLAQGLPALIESGVVRALHQP